VQNNHPVVHQPYPQPFTRVLKSIKRQRLDRTQSSPLPFSPSKSSYLQSHAPNSPLQHSNAQPSLSLLSHHDHPTLAHPPTTKPKSSPRDLNPCHVCKRRPTLLSELDQYTNCEGCGERTCWICVRECEGWGISPRTTRGGKPWSTDDSDRMIDEEDDRSGRIIGSRGWSGGEDGHRGVVCSRCCVEKGGDGEVWCLGCLRSESDGMD